MNSTHTLFSRRALRGALAGTLLGLALTASAQAAGTLDKAKESGKLTLGYSADTRPYAYVGAAGKPAGYAIDLCAKVAEAVKGELKLSSLAVDYVALSRDDAFVAVQQGKVDLLCLAIPSLERRALVDFSIPIMLGGTSVAVRTDAPSRLLDALSGRAPVGPAWRGSPDQAPQRVRVAVLGGAPLEKVLAGTLKERRIVVDIVPVKDTGAGMQLLASREADAFFNDRALLLDAVRQGAAPHVVVLDRLFRRDLAAMAMRRGDDDFRLVVDRALSRLYRTPDLAAIYATHFGPPTAGARDFFQLVTLPD